MSRRPKRAYWFAGSGQIDLTFICLPRKLFILLLHLLITFDKASIPVWRVITLSCRTPALLSETALATPAADYSGSRSSSTTSSGTLKSSWWAQMESRWWGGTQASACPPSEKTSEHTFSAAALMRKSIKQESYRHKISSFWPTKVACSMKRRLENSNSVVPLWNLSVTGSSSVHSSFPEKHTVPCCLLTLKTCCHLCHMVT